jgi:DnaJ family protein A protein 2
MAEEHDLEDVDPRNQARAHGAAGMDDEDEDGIPQGAERMQCASQ